MFRMHALDVWEIEPFLRQFGQESWLIQSNWLHKCFIVRIGWIPWDFLYSRMMVLELFCWHCLIQLFLLFLLSRKKFWKNHKLKKGWIWRGLLGASWLRLCSFEREFFTLSESPYEVSPEVPALYEKSRKYKVISSLSVHSSIFFLEWL